MKVAILSTFALFYSASLTLATETGCAIVLKTSDGFLNLREGPGTQFRVIAKLNRDDFLYVGTEQCYAGRCTDERHSWTRLEGLPRLNRHRLGKRQLYPVGRLSRELPGLWAVRRPSGRLVELQLAAKRKRSDQRRQEAGFSVSVAPIDPNIGFVRRPSAKDSRALRLAAGAAGKAEAKRGRTG